MANYLYMHETTDPWWNLAVDEYLLRNIGVDDMLLHIYVNSSCVVIGKYQNAWRECNLMAMEADGVKVVRRISGGGAVFHDLGNVNFSFMANEKAYNVPRQMEVIIRTVHALGIHAECSGRNDVLVEGKKISGNAFCEIGPRCQHHGTLLVNSDLNMLGKYLNVSEKKIRSKGVKSVQSRVTNLCDYVSWLRSELVISALCAAFADEYGDYKIMLLSAGAREELDRLYKKQASWNWRLGRTPQFDILLESRFSWGEIQILISLTRGVITKVDVFTDALNTELPKVIAHAIQGVSLLPRQMEECIRSKAQGRHEMEELADWIGKLTF